MAMRAVKPGAPIALIGEIIQYVFVEASLTLCLSLTFKTICGCSVRYRPADLPKTRHLLFMAGWGWSVRKGTGFHPESQGPPSNRLWVCTLSIFLLRDFARSQGLSVVEEFCGHFIGRRLHLPPLVPHCFRGFTHSSNSLFCPSVHRLHA